VFNADDTLSISGDLTSVDTLCDNSESLAYSLGGVSARHWHSQTFAPGPRAYQNQTQLKKKGELFLYDKLICEFSYSKRKYQNDC